MTAWGDVVISRLSGLVSYFEPDYLKIVYIISILNPHRSVSIQSSMAVMSRPRETGTADSPLQPPLQRHRVEPPADLALEPATASLVTLTPDPPADPSTRPE
ncbi:hypothetical protein R1flu_013831 [Riccia fluitans]|uniref:Uncharacterized protein n=1 Tax=Riccia fluitans TaxID=41844 RepID=A0ABD1YEQ4_9MARC